MTILWTIHRLVDFKKIISDWRLISKKIGGLSTAMVHSIFGLVKTYFRISAENRNKILKGNPLSSVPPSTKFNETDSLTPFHVPSR